MLKQSISFATLVLIVTLASCNQAAPPTPDTREADAKAIRDAETSAQRDWAERDASKISSKVEVSRAADYAYSQGTYVMSMTDPKSKKVLTEKGKYVTVYKKQFDGLWKAVADINNADAPATATQ